MAGKIVGGEQEQIVEKTATTQETQKMQKPVEPSEPNMMVVEGLPSRGIFYPNGTVIKARPLKVIEVKKLSTLNETNADHIINDIVRRATTGIAVDDLLVADKLYIVFWLRANTYNEAGYTIEFKCSRCEQDSSYEFSLNNLDVKYLPENANKNSLQVLLPDGTEIVWSLPRVRDERQKTKFHTSFETLLPEIDDEILAQAVNIDTINGKDVDLLEKYNWLINLKTTHYSILLTEMEKFECGIKPILNVTCKKCGGTAPVAVTFRDEFFLPRYKAEANS